MPECLGSAWAIWFCYWDYELYIVGGFTANKGDSL